MFKKIAVLTAVLTLGGLAFFAATPEASAAGRGGFAVGGFRGGVGAVGFRGGVGAVGYRGGFGAVGYRGGFVGSGVGFGGSFVGPGGVYRGGFVGPGGIYRPGFVGPGWGGYGWRGGYWGGYPGYGYGLGLGLPYGGVYLGDSPIYNDYYPVAPVISGTTIVPEGSYIPGFSSAAPVAPDYSSGLASNNPQATLTSQANYVPQANIPQGITDNSSLITVHVPANAKVWFDGSETNGNGTVREFKSPPLNPGSLYHYNVKVSWMENGSPVTQTRQVNVSAGNHVNVDFTPASGSTVLTNNPYGK